VVAEADSTTCIVAGGGPAGIMLGLLLARGGIDVTVMEKHADFLRDFRGDTGHTSTLRLLDELGLAADFARMPHREIQSLNMLIQGTPVEIDLRRIPGPHKHIALVPQWDFLELLAAAADKEPTFRLLRSTEVLSPIRRGDKVIGVSYRDSDGQVGELYAELTVACDGRSSTLRNTMGLKPRNFGAPMDVLARVQVRRWLPAVLVQSVQRVIHNRVIAVAVSAGQPVKPPLLVRIANKVPALRAAAGYAVAVGPLPEHVPAFARR
jgi:2-polyprenyl-6-methoxyphenol hydroxylase-like FAD-dependent oxidoreductase